jgi:four helix bundle protein
LRIDAVVIGRSASIHWKSERSCGLDAAGERIARCPVVSAADDLQARTDAFADLSIKFVAGLPDTPRVQKLANQFQASSTSVGANYRAARRAKSHADFTSKIGTVSEEADESVYWLTRLNNNGIRSALVDIRVLLKEADELARIFGAAHRTARRRRRRDHQ